MFRATAGLTIDQQLQMASQLQTQGDDVLKTIQQMKKTSKTQKQATKTNNLKFEWLQEHSHLKRLEENCSKELESMLLRMYNDASTARELKKQESQATPAKRENSTAFCAHTENSYNEDNNCDDHGIDESLVSSSTLYAIELEELVRTEQLNRVALIKQITSEREQRAALKELLVAFSQEQNPKHNNQTLAGDMRSNVHELIFDAVIGLQMIEATLEDEVQACEREFACSYRKALETLRNCGNEPLSVETMDSQEHKIIAILDAAGGNQCQDEMLRIVMAEELRKAFTELRHDISQYEIEFIGAASATDAAGSIEAAKSKCGGWGECDDERFLNVLRTYKTKHGTGKNPQMLYDQLALVVPAIPLVEIKKHAKFHQHLRFYQQKCKDRQRELQRRLQELQNEAATKFQMAREMEKERQRKMEQMNEMQQQCQQRHSQVSEWRVTKEAKERIEKQQREIERMIEFQKQQEEELRRKKKNDQQKLVVGEYKKGKALEKMADEKLTIDEEQKREAERIQQSLINAERVQFRQDEFQQKLKVMKLEEIQKAHLEEQRLAKLNELKEKTPYAQIIANIVPDPERTRQETVAFRANVEAVQDGLPITETGLFPSHGYDCETLFKNARFKLGIALRNAGLNSSEYARQALTNVKVCNVGAYRNHVAESTALW